MSSQIRVKSNIFDLTPIFDLKNALSNNLPTPSGDDGEPAPPPAPPLPAPGDRGDQGAELSEAIVDEVIGQLVARHGEDLPPATAGGEGRATAADGGLPSTAPGGGLATRAPLEEKPATAGEPVEAGGRMPRLLLPFPGGLEELLHGLVGELAYTPRTSAGAMQGPGGRRGEQGGRGVRGVGSSGSRRKLATKLTSLSRAAGRGRGAHTSTAIHREEADEVVVKGKEQALQEKAPGADVEESVARPVVVSGWLCEVEELLVALEVAAGLAVYCRISARAAEPHISLAPRRGLFVLGLTGRPEATPQQCVAAARGALVEVWLVTVGDPALHLACCLLAREEAGVAALHCSDLQELARVVGELVAASPPIATRLTDTVTRHEELLLRLFPSHLTSFGAQDILTRSNLLAFLAAPPAALPALVPWLPPAALQEVRLGLIGFHCILYWKYVPCITLTVLNLVLQVNRVATKYMLAREDRHTLQEGGWQQDAEGWPAEEQGWPGEDSLIEEKKRWSQEQQNRPQEKRQRRHQEEKQGWSGEGNQRQG